MTGDTTRVLIETIVRKALREIQDSPERTIRNLVDMAQHFAKGRFQRHFFEASQKMLENENSPYYVLVKDTAYHVDPERLLAFGINVGYNSCTLGARRIREIEEKEGYNIPWALPLYLEAKTLEDHMEQYQRLIAQGEKLGIYTWFLICHDQPFDVMGLIADHPDSAFVLFFHKEYGCPQLLEEAADLKQLLLAVEYDEDQMDFCAQMRDMGMLYAVYDEYDDETAEDIFSGERLWAMQQMHPHVAVLIGAAGCSEQVRHKVYDHVISSRAQQIYQMIPWEFTMDNRFVDTVISTDACLAGFTASGQLYTPRQIMQGKAYNLFENDLDTILKSAFPKAGSENE